MAKQYYYLVASLPNLILEHEVKGFDFMQLKEFVLESIGPDDARLVDLLFAPIDIQNILSIKFNEYQPFIEGGKFTEEELKAELTEPQYIPQYIIEQLNHIEKCEADKDEMGNMADDELIAGPEVLLLKKFYAYVEDSKNSFLTQWFSFDRELRNIQAAVAARKMDISVEEYLIGEDEITEQLIKSTASDFGLRRERDYIDRLWQILDDTDVLERERKLDLMRWQYIDDITTFNYFDINTVLAFLEKAHIINRWMKLDVETGIAMFEQLVGELKQSYNPDEVFKN